MARGEPSLVHWEKGKVLTGEEEEEDEEDVVEINLSVKTIHQFIGRRQRRRESGIGKSLYKGRGQRRRSWRGWRELV